MAFCKIMFIGNLGRDPEMRYTPNGKAVTQFTVAVNQSKPDPNAPTGWTDETDWFRVSVFGDRAERVADQIRKGNKVFVEGRFKSREFETNDGQKRTSLDVIADNVINLERRGREEGAEGSFSIPQGERAAAPAGAAAGGGGGNATGGRGYSGGRDDTDLDDLPF